MAVTDSIRHGLFWHHSFQRLKKYGFEFNPYYLVREQMHGNNAEQLALPDEYSVGQLRADEIGQLEQLARWATTVEVERRLKLGHLCIVLRHGSEVAGYTWADLAEVNDSVCDYQLKANEAYLYDAFVSPKHRGGGLASKMRYASYQTLQDLGVKAFVSISDFYNESSIKFKRRLNAQPDSLYLYIKLAGLKILHFKLKHYAQPAWSAQ